MNEINKILKEQYDKLSQDLKEAIGTTDLREKLLVISKKHGLHIDKAGELENETVMVMVGLEPTHKYVKNLKRALGVPDDVVQRIANDVNETVFKEIRSSLMKIQQGESLPEQKSVVITPPMIQPEKTSSEERKVGATMVETENIDRDRVLKEIEDVPSTQQEKVAERTLGIESDKQPTKGGVVLPVGVSEPDEAPPDIALEKLTKTVSMPQETVSVQDSGEQKKGEYHGQDPYREPVE